MCRLLTLKIRLCTVFSVLKTTLVQVRHRISSSIRETNLKGPFTTLSNIPTLPEGIHLQLWWQSNLLQSLRKGLWYTGIFLVHWPDSYAKLMSPNKGETAVHGCHCPSNMAVHMREVLPRPWVGVCVPLALSLSYSQKVRSHHKILSW